MKDYDINGKLIIAMSRALRTAHESSEVMFRQNGLTHAQFEALEALHHKGAMTVGELIEAVLSTSGNMTVVIRNLEQAGLVRRRKNEADGRSYLIDLTDDGRRTISHVFEKHMRFVEEALSPLSENEKKSIIDTLKKLR